MRNAFTPQAAKTLGLCLITTFAASCSLDVLPVSQSRLQSAQKANAPIARGPGSPGAFTQAWSFTGTGGYLIDPAKIEISNGAARVKPTGIGQPQILQTTIGRPYIALDRFTEVTGPANHGTIHYQLSNDGSHWFWFDGSKWVSAPASFQQTNAAADVNTHIPTFHMEVGAGSLYLKAYLSAPTDQQTVELKQVEVAGIAPETDSWVPGKQH